MEDETPKPGHGQLEQTLENRIQVLYFTQLGHKPNKVSCHLVDKTLTVTVENSITKPVQLLAEIGKQELAELARFNIDKAFKTQLKALIEEVLGVSVIELLGDSKLETGLTTMLAVLAAAPKVRLSNKWCPIQMVTDNGFQLIKHVRLADIVITPC